MALATPGWFTDPQDSSRTRWWNGLGWTTLSHPKDQFTQSCIEKGLKVPDYDYDPENIPEGLVINNAHLADATSASSTETTPPAQNKPGEWVRSGDLPGNFWLLFWVENGRMSEYFHMDAVIQAVVPDFIINGGTPDLVERWNSNTLTQQEIDVVMMLISRTPPEKVRAMSGDSAPEYNNGPNWITEPGNPSIANWWDGRQFTGERELVSVILQRHFDSEAEVIETVSQVEPPEGRQNGWHIDPENDTELIHWGGLRWDRRKTVESTIKERFDDVNEQVPPQWTGVQRATPRCIDLMAQLVARAQGVDGWYKEPHRFDDLSMRYWAQGAWTEHTSAQQAGWFDDPWNDEFTRYWDGRQWTPQTKSKEAERIREEKSQARKQALASIAAQVMDDYKKNNTPEMKRQRRIDEANDHSRRLRNAAAIEQEQFYRDRQKSWWK
jgi:hypothetical protein